MIFQKEQASSEKGEELSKAQVLLYDVDENGKCSVESRPMPVIGPLMDLYMGNKIRRVMENKEALLSGEISPIKFYMEYCGLYVKDLASRMKISESKLKKHLTMKGFYKIKIETLKKYAEIFDIALADLFQFIDIGNNFKVEVRNYNKGVIQNISINNI